MAKLVAISLGIPGFDLSVDYNAVNLRLTQVTWVIADGVRAGVSMNINGTPFSREIIGPSAGGENVPSNYRVVLVSDEQGEYYDFPPQITDVRLWAEMP